MKKLLLVMLLLAGCSNPKTIVCKECGSSAVKLKATSGMNGVKMDVYQCPNLHVTYKEQ
jgi:hypothetical protein